MKPNIINIKSAMPYNKYVTWIVTGRVINGLIKARHGAYRKYYKVKYQTWPCTAMFSFGKTSTYRKGWSKKYFFEGYFLDEHFDNEIYYIRGEGATQGLAEADLHLQYVRIRDCVSHEFREIGKLDWLLKCEKCDVVHNISGKETINE